VPALRPTHVETYVITVPVYAMVEHAKGGHARTTVGSRQVRIRVAVDLQRIAEDLGPKAARSKHQKARGLHGAVLLQVVR
jgi:hypothetical protein